MCVGIVEIGCCVGKYFVCLFWVCFDFGVWNIVEIIVVECDEGIGYDLCLWC